MRHRSAFLPSELSHQAEMYALQRHQSTVSEPAAIYRGQIGQMRDGVSEGLHGLDGYSSKLNFLLIFVPLAFIAYLMEMSSIFAFSTSFLGMVPLAMLLGKATEDIAEHTNDTLGAMVNVTFGNAVELILAISALHAGKMQLIQDTIAGSVLSNLLLVLGSSFFFGGLVHYEQVVLPAVSEANADLLSFAVFGLSVPALYATAVPKSDQMNGAIEMVSLFTSIGLLVIYGMYLFFQMYTHAELYEPASTRNSLHANGVQGQGPDESAAMMEEAMRSIDTEGEDQRADQGADNSHSRVASLPAAIIILTVMVAFVAVLSEILVSSIDGFSEKVGLGEKFIAVILLPVVGNAVEHLSAILVARHNKIDLSIGIACGSSVQIALFAAPLLVVISWIFGPQHLTLNFQLFETICIGFSVFVVNATLRDSRTNWLEGAVLITCYFIVATAFFFIK